MASTTVSTAGNQTNGARVTFRNSSGTPYVLVFNSGNIQMWKGNSTTPTSFSEVDAANAPDDANYLTPSGAIDSSDLIHVVWFDNDTGMGAGGGCRYATFNADGTTDTWSSSTGTTIGVIQDGAPTNPGTAVAIDSNDVPHVAYVDKDTNMGTTYDTFFYVNKVGGSWNTVVEVDGFSNAISCLAIDIAIGADNYPYVSYRYTPQSSMRYGYATSNNPSSFTTAQIDNTNDSSTTSICVNSDGDIFVGYRESNPGSGYASIYDVTNTTIRYNSNVGNDVSLVADGTDVYMFYVDDASDIVYDMWDGSSWLGETSLETGTFTDAKAKWAFWVDNDSSGTNLGTNSAVVDSYSALATNIETQDKIGQSFTGDGGVLGSVGFKISALFSPAGPVKAEVYAHTGTYGSTGVPSGTALATSNSIDGSSLTNGAFNEFTFPTSDQITLVNGTKYFAVIDTTGLTSGIVSVYTEDTSATHGGNYAEYVTSSWSANSSWDAEFSVKQPARLAASEIDYTFNDGSGIEWNTLALSTTTTNSDTITSDSVIATTNSDTITSDSSISDTFSDTITSDSKILLVNSDTITSDTNIAANMSDTITSDSVIKNTRTGYTYLATVDSYAGSSDAGYPMYDASNTIVGQSFTGNGTYLSSCEFVLRRQGTPSGLVTATLYAHSGTYGTSSVGTGTALTTSTTAFDVTNISDTDNYTYRFDFDGTYLLANGTYYVIAIEFSGTGDATNKLNVRFDNTSPTHDGNSCRYSGSWLSNATDLLFTVTGVVYGITSDSNIISVNSDTITSDTNIVSTMSKTIVSDANIQIVSSDTISSDANIVTQNSETITSNSVIQTTQSDTVTSDSVIQSTRSDTIVSDTNIIIVNSDTITSDSNIALNQSDTITSDSNLLTPFYPDVRYGFGSGGTFNSSISDIGQSTSVRFTALDNLTADSAYCYFNGVSGGSSATVRVGLQGDSGGSPDGTWLASGNAYNEFSAVTGWNGGALVSNASLTKDTVYHWVIEYISGDHTCNYQGFLFESINYRSRDSAFDISQKWSQSATYMMPWLIGHTDGTKTGNVYSTFTTASTAIYGDNWSAQVHTVSDNHTRVIDTIYIPLNTVVNSPPNDLEYSIRDSDNNDLRTGTFTNSKSLATGYNILKATLSSPLTLTSGQTYYFVYHTTGGDASNYYSIRNARINTTGGDYTEETYGGSNSAVSLSTDAGSTWGSLQTTWDMGIRAAYTDFYGESFISSDSVIQKAFSDTISSDSEILIATVTNSDTITSDANISKTFSDTIVSDSVINTTESDSIVSDAIIQTTESDSITSDSVIQTTETDSITSNSNIQTTESDTITSDTEIASVFSDVIVSDSVIQTTESNTISSDSIISITSSDSITSDSVIKNTVSDTITSSSYIMEEGQQLISSDSVIRKTLSDSIVSDSVIVEEFSDSISSDSVISKTQSDSIISDSVINQTQSETITSDSVIVKTFSDTITSDSVIKSTESDTITSVSDIKNTVSSIIVSDTEIANSIKATIISDSHIKSTETDIIASDSIISKVLSNTIVSDSIIITTSSDTINSNSFIKEEGQQLISSDSVIRKAGMTETITSDLVIVFTQSDSITSDSTIKSTESTSIISNSLINKTSSDSIIADTNVKVTNSDTITSVTVLGAGFGDTITSDSVIKTTQSDTIISDTNIGVVQTDSIVSDASISDTFSDTITSDSRVKATQTKTIVSDSVLDRGLNTYSDTITSDTIITKTQSDSVTSNSLIIYLQSDTITSDSVISLTSSDSIVSDLTITKTQQDTIISDTNLQKTFSDSIITDSVIAGGTSDSIVSDSFIKTTLSDTITTDLIIYESSTQTITSDANIASVKTKTIVSDSIIFKTQSGDITSGTLILYEGYISPTKPEVISGNKPIPKLVEGLKQQPRLVNNKTTPKPILRHKSRPKLLGG